MKGRAAWLLLDNASAAIIAFGFFVVTARLLTPAEFGAAALALAIAQIATPMIESLFHDALIQREDLDDRHVRTATAATLLWAAALALALALVAPFAGEAFAAPGLGQCLPWFGVALLASGAMAVPAALARRRLDFRLLAIRTVTARSIATIVGIALLVMGFGIWAVVAQFVLSALIAALFVLLATPRPLILGIDRPALGELLRFAAPTMGSQLLLFANSRIATLLVGGVMGPVAAGAWNVAMRFVEPLQTMAATTIGQLALPIYARHQGDRDQLRRAWALGSRRAAFLLVPMFVGLGCCAEPVIELFVGPRWTSVAPVMTIICLAMALIIARQLCEIVFTAIGRPRISFMIQLQASLLSLGGLLAGLFLGLVPAALGWSLRALPFVTVSAAQMRRQADIPWAEQWAVLRGPVIATGAMAALLWTIAAIMPAQLPAAVRLLALIPIGGGAYLAVLCAIDRFARADALALLGRFRDREPQASGKRASN